jgi:hypothetical protein
MEVQELKSASALILEEHNGVAAYLVTIYASISIAREEIKMVRSLT